MRKSWENNWKSTKWWWALVKPLGYPSRSNSSLKKIEKVCRATTRGKRQENYIIKKQLKKEKMAINQGKEKRGELETY